eukprot:10065535-Alexandrium_andersonii.AAC.1
MEESPEDDWGPQSLAKDAALKLNATESVPMDDAVIDDIVDFRAPEEPEDPGRPEPSDVSGVRAW